MNSSRKVHAVGVLAAIVLCHAAGGAKPSASRKAGTKSSSVSSPLRAVDTATRKGASRNIDSVAAVRSDSLRRTDSVHVADSLALAERTWRVAAPTDRFPRLGGRLEVELRRGAKVRVALGPIPDTSIDAVVAAARAIGAGKVLVAEAGPSVQGRRILSGRVLDVRSRVFVDSARVASDEAGADRFASIAARSLVRRFFPDKADSTCRADSVLQANRIWFVAPLLSSEDSGRVGRQVRDSLVAGLRRSDRATWTDAVLPSPCPVPACVDSVAAAAGAEIVLHARLSRRSDSTWTLSVAIVRARDGAPADSLLVADPDPTGLARRALANLAAPPASCSATCGLRTSRDMWSFRLDVDSGTKPAGSALEGALVREFQARQDRQFLAIPSKLGPGGWDSAARAAGIGRPVSVRLSGSDFLWRMVALVGRSPGGVPDTVRLIRGGPRSRVFGWFARHLAAWGAEDPPCGDNCRRDSLRESRSVWAVVPPSTVDPISPDPGSALRSAFFALGKGRVDSLPGPIPDPDGLDSLAQSRSIDMLVRPSLVRTPDSLWVLTGRVSEVATGLQVDSLEVRSRGAWDSASGPLSRRLVAGLLGRRTRRCDSCVSTDTLEAALAITPVGWSGAPDSLGRAFRDTLAKVFAVEGAFQVSTKMDSASGGGRALDSSDLSRLRCRTGAIHVVESRATLDSAGWHVEARLVEVGSGKVVSSLDYREKGRDPRRALELAPWVARRLMGTDTSAVAPKPPPKIPLRKVLLLGIPAVVGIGSVILHW